MGMFMVYILRRQFLISLNKEFEKNASEKLTYSLNVLALNEPTLANACTCTKRQNANISVYKP